MTFNKGTELGISIHQNHIDFWNLKWPESREVKLGVSKPLEIPWELITTSETHQRILGGHFQPPWTYSIAGPQPLSFFLSPHFWSSQREKQAGLQTSGSPRTAPIIISSINGRRQTGNFSDLLDRGLSVLLESGRGQYPSLESPRSQKPTFPLSWPCGCTAESY